MKVGNILWFYWKCSQFYCLENGNITRILKKWHTGPSIISFLQIFNFFLVFNVGLARMLWSWVDSSCRYLAGNPDRIISLVRVRNSWISVLYAFHNVPNVSWGFPSSRIWHRVTGLFFPRCFEMKCWYHLQTSIWPGSIRNHADQSPATRCSASEDWRPQLRGSYRKSWATFFCMRTGNSRRRRVRC